MRVDLGPRDERRFVAVAAEEREYLQFILTLCLGTLSVRPYQPEALENAAAALTTLGYYNSGLLLDRRLQALFPDDQTVNYNLACSLSLNGKCDEGLAMLEKAIRLGYRDAKLMSTDADLENLRSLPRFAQLLKLAGNEKQ